jgi:hypothetical protein
MAHTYRLLSGRTAFSVGGASTTATVNPTDTVIVCLVKVTGATTRLGTVPTVGGVAMTQASTAQLAAAAPECSCELWYLLNANQSGSQTLAVPVSNGVSGFVTWAAGQSATGASSWQGEAGTNGTSTNPAPGSVTPSAAGNIGFAIVASGATTWAPTAQAGTIIANTDDGADGGGEQYIITPNATAVNLGWTFATSDDWGAISVFFKEQVRRTLSTMVSKQAIRRASYY